MKKRLFFTILGLVILFGGIFGYEGFVAYKTNQYFAQHKPPPETVTATRAVAATWHPKIKAVGSLKAVHGIDVTAEISGKVVKVAVEDGAHVDKGQLLIELESDGLRAQLAGARAAANLARIDLKRQQRLRKRRANSESAVDRAQSKLRQARANADNIRSQLDKKTIQAPFAGRLGIVHADIGQYIRPGDAIVTLQTLDPIDVDFAVPQQQLAVIKAGQKVVAHVDAYGDQAFTGHITAISPKVDSATRNVPVRARLANPQGRLQPGMFVDTAVELAQQKDVITLPATAISYNPYGDSVFVIHTGESDAGKNSDNKGGDGATADNASGDGDTTLIVQRKFVKTGGRRGDQVQITQGLKVGDRVVTSGQLKLKNGTRVEIKQSPKPANNPSPDVGNH